MVRRRVLRGLPKLALLALLAASSCLPARGAFSKTPAAALSAAAGDSTAAVRTLPALGGQATVHWTLDEERDVLYVALEAATTGWVGLGFGEAAAMRGADIAVAHVDAQGEPHVTDYHAVGNEAPIKDGTWPYSFFFSFSSRASFAVSYWFIPYAG
jgi:hypothetical protein